MCSIFIDSAVNFWLCFVHICIEARFAICRIVCTLYIFYGWVIFCCILSHAHIFKWSLCDDMGTSFSLSFSLCYSSSHSLVRYCYYFFFSWSISGNALKSHAQTIKSANERRLSYLISLCTLINLLPLPLLLWFRSFMWHVLFGSNRELSSFEYKMLPFFFHSVSVFDVQMCRKMKSISRYFVFR